MNNIKGMSKLRHFYEINITIKYVNEICICVQYNTIRGKYKVFQGSIYVREPVPLFSGASFSC